MNYYHSIKVYGIEGECLEMVLTDFFLELLNGVVCIHVEEDGLIVTFGSNI